MNNKPTIVITLGDPCGIGPEVVVKALAHREVIDWCRPIVVGSVEAVRATVSMLDSNLTPNVVEGPESAEDAPDVINIIDPENLEYGRVSLGQLSAEAGKASMEWVLRAAELCSSGQAQALVTAPVNKAATRLGGFQDVGHMEVLQRLTEAKEVATMLMSGRLRVVHLTTHRSLRRACDYVTTENILAKLKLTHTTFQEWGFPQPRIGVAALNPHASDGGLIGDEEAREIEPAIREARMLGVDAEGPVPADTIFHQAIAGKYDVVLAMYHDQGHIPVKVYGLEKSVSVNLGLPIIRTSVDHGTAFDIAGKGIANAESMVEATRLAISLARDGRLP